MPVTANFAGPVQTDAANRFRMFQSIARSHIGGPGQSIANGQNTALGFDTNDINTDGIWSGGSNTRFTAQIAGKYLILGGVEFVSNPNGNRQIVIRKNGGLYYGGTLVPAASGVGTQVTVSDVLLLAANDYIEFMVNQTSGGPLNANASNQSFGAMLYVGE